MRNLLLLIGAAVVLATNKVLAATSYVLPWYSNPTPPSFIRFAGGLSRKDAANLRTFVDGASFSKVDKADWK